ncbi:hypothetical protein [uncultured Microbulbifer sp.]|uniref:hypothetical protein n=1 Tax=uncultured Microbulbifer sp. TaxID=348147 RepID=UPI00262C480B|nr:hypothetical protein [uncultured Microbulbifer sp.]
MHITINPEILKELEYLIELHQQYGAIEQMDSVESLIRYVMTKVADGSRRPGAWERQMLDMMGLVADCDAHNYYRAQYGK